ncbi:TetR/AcrR family transcriptional regulator [Haloechinothrix sp. YIM 98757]|uniref:TetR/AcrR family transcriptional regulator n=1 Tax=Haloechinothrix aidingensis TaxID=2752311 RepID=A0A838AEE5_9PSEU|nr:TetR/AcrR family transcriptional regulator [Haloechinothrix aidingensis]MBA0127652.1 TetR/AcrR family transcriptional regulator [Haloechinothrix aidingensis]
MHRSLRYGSRLGEEVRVSVEQGRYHHGDLPAAMLSAVREIVREQGINAVTLRAAARRAGVSHAAPAHHFGDKVGLLTAFATEGCEMLRARLLAARDGAGEESALLVIGTAYVRFALDEPEHFAVMFRADYTRREDPTYRQAREGAFAVLLDTVREVREGHQAGGAAGDDADGDREAEQDVEQGTGEDALLCAATGAWSLVHGIATLWLDGNLDTRITDRSAEDTAAALMTTLAETLLEAAGGAPTSQ